MLSSNAPETSKASLANPGPIREVASGHFPKFLHGWLTFSSAALTFHPSLPSHGDPLSSLFPVPSLCKSKGPASVCLASHWLLALYWLIKNQLGTRTFSVWTHGFLILGAGLIQSFRTNPQQKGSSLTIMLSLFQRLTLFRDFFSFLSCSFRGLNRWKKKGGEGWKEEKPTK